MQKKIFLALCLMGLLTIVGCEGLGNSYDEKPQCIKIEEEQLLQEITQEAEEDGLNQAHELFLPPNEAGQIMILMYHRFGESESQWQRTWDNFRRDLERLYEEGYRLVSIKDYLDNTINVPAGYSPVILTFDDGYASQLDIEKKENDEWILKAQTAVGIMYDFYQEHPDFGLEAIFYVNSRPFNYRNWGAASNYLVNELGMDIGNHTRSHINMKRYTADEIAVEVGGLVKDFKEVLPDYEIDSLSLPLGVSPAEGIELSGEYGEIKYENRGILLVGANPAFSPIDKRYNALKIPRIRADEENFTRWLVFFKENSHLRYVSDGDAEKITVPKDMLDVLNEGVLSDRRLHIYERELD